MAIDPKSTEMKADRCVLLICDIQEKFRGMYKFDKVLQNSLKLINILSKMNVRLIFTEYRPKIYGHTVSEIDGFGFICYETNRYNMCMDEVMDAIKSFKKKSTNKSIPFHVILIGMETHISVENTAIDLKKRGYEVDVVAECCTSRFQENKLVALQRMRDIGCHITTVESIVSKLLVSSHDGNYKYIESFLNNPSEPTGFFSSHPNV